MRLNPFRWIWMEKIEKRALYPREETRAPFHFRGNTNLQFGDRATQLDLGPIQLCAFACVSRESRDSVIRNRKA
jgi:hypothetical protein